MFAKFLYTVIRPFVHKLLNVIFLQVVIKAYWICISVTGQQRISVATCHFSTIWFLQPLIHTFQHIKR